AAVADHVDGGNVEGLAGGSRLVALRHTSSAGGFGARLGTSRGSLIGARLASIGSSLRCVGGVTRCASGGCRGSSAPRTMYLYFMAHMGGEILRRVQLHLLATLFFKPERAAFLANAAVQGLFALG